jgi:hypothetical protein
MGPQHELGYILLKESLITIHILINITDSRNEHIRTETMDQAIEQ